MTVLDLTLNDRVAIVTGGGQGVGLACVKTLAAAGMSVVAADLETQQLDDVAADHDRVRALRLDLTDPTAPEQLVRTAIEEHGTVDVLVNNLADIGEAQPFHDIDDQTWEHSLAVNLLATVRTCRAAIPHMTAAGRGAIITIGSDAGELPHPDFAPYSVTKAALMNLSKVLSKAYGQHGVRSNLIAPGLLRTHATAAMLDDLAEQHGSEAGGVQALAMDVGMAIPRIAEADEVASLVAYLASDLAAQITGTVVRIDGGTVPTI